jgi:hypothetical protein
MATADRRLVVLMEEKDYLDLQRQAERLGRSMASLVREAVREKLAEQRAVGEEERTAAVDLLCEEHDPDFDWARAKRDLERRCG